MPDDLAIRVAGATDIRAIASLRLAWGDGSDGDPNPDPDERPGFERHLAEWIAQEGDRRTIWLAELAGEPVGMATLYEFRRMPPAGPDGLAAGGTSATCSCARTAGTEASAPRS